MKNMILAMWVIGLPISLSASAQTICSHFNADDAILADGSYGDLDHADKKLVKLESRGGRSQKMVFSGEWQLSRQARVDDIKGLTMPVVLSSNSEGLAVGIFLYNVRTKGWHPALTVQPTSQVSTYSPTIDSWRDFYDDKTRQIRFQLRTGKNQSAPINLALDQLSIRPLWQAQQISHEQAEKVAAGDDSALTDGNLDARSLRPSIEMRRPEPQPGERYRSLQDAPQEKQE